MGSTEDHHPQKRAATRPVTAGRRCVRASPHAVQHASHPTGNERDRRREMNGCRQEALTINMAREHAATPRRNTGENGERGKSKKQHNTHGRNKLQARKAPPRPSPWPATPHQPSHTHTIAVLPVRGREDSALHTTNAHTASSHTPMDKNEKRHTATASSSIPRPTGYGHSPAANTQRTRSQQSPKEPRGSGPSSTHDAAPHSMRSHGMH
ncbi:exo-alpha-sialidase [Trypanosoma cruzi]|nr:exo-alpha-sialidase [Trypanosoma cruzi]